MVAALGHFIQNDPAPVIALVPSEEDARTLMVATIEPVFAESPALRDALAQDTSRDTLLHRRYPGGSLMVLSARAPRNLRARTARVIIADEIDAYEIDLRGEGDPVELAIKRTMTYGNRKIVLASTPLHAESSRIVRAYERSDMRVFEIGCPHCQTFNEVLWMDIRWPDGRPQEAAWCCPDCGALVEEREKPRLVCDGRWRATAPHVEGHAGFKLTALTSLLPNASWPRLAAEFLAAKRSPVTLQPFVNTVLGEPWRADGDEIDPAALSARHRPHCLDSIPGDTLVLTAGCDLQDDRIEMTTVGWNGNGDARVLAHEVVWGSPLDDATWRELDDLLRRHWVHPAGGIIRLGAAVIDSGHHADQVYAFTRPRTSRRIVAGKGVSGFSRPSLSWGSSRKTRLALIGVDALKLAIHQRLGHGDTITISDALGQDYLDQLGAERLVTRYSHGQPVRQWEKISGRRNETLDCLCYAFAAQKLMNITRGKDRDRTAGVKVQSGSIWSSKWISGMPH